MWQQCVATYLPLDRPESACRWFKLEPGDKSDHIPAESKKCEKPKLYIQKGNSVTKESTEDIIYIKKQDDTDPNMFLIYMKLMALQNVTLWDLVYIRVPTAVEI